MREPNICRGAVLTRFVRDLDTFHRWLVNRRQIDILTHESNGMLRVEKCEFDVRIRRNRQVPAPGLCRAKRWDEMRDARQAFRVGVHPPSFRVLTSGIQTANTQRGVMTIGVQRNRQRLPLYAESTADGSTRTVPRSLLATTSKTRTVSDSTTDVQDNNNTVPDPQQWITTFPLQREANQMNQCIQKSPQFLF